MIECCNALQDASFKYIWYSGKYYYRRIEFGICQNCGCLKFKDYIIDHTGKQSVKVFTGKKASQKLEQWRKKIRNTRYGSKSNQNVYYGDFKKTNRLDENNIPIYQQLRKNFNGQSEVIGEVETKLLSSINL